ncbi:MAG TPA: rhombosortase [Roseateles sp.]|nr:rhombosortase [Roseateles sp.]
MSPWPALAALLGALALLAWPLPTTPLDWQPALAAHEPWRLLSAAAVHWSLQHLLANLAGCAVLAWVGLAARLHRRAALAWLLAWPLTQAGLLLRPDLLHYGGLSGVLHAGTAVLAVELLGRRGQERAIGAAIAAGLLLKLALEQPWGPALQTTAGWDIAIAPAAHLSGALAGAMCALTLRLLARPRA